MFSVKLKKQLSHTSFERWPPYSREKGDQCNISFCLCLSASSQTVSFYNKDESGEIQKVTFDTDRVKKIFHGSFHKVKSRLSVFD